MNVFIIFWEKDVNSHGSTRHVLNTRINEATRDKNSLSS